METGTFYGTAKKVILSRGGFTDVKGHLHLIVKDECLMASVNCKQQKVKLYQLGDGGTNWLETIELDEFKRRFPEVSKKS